jgi:hypothetical protein
MYIYLYICNHTYIHIYKYTYIQIHIYIGYAQLSEAKIELKECYFPFNTGYLNSSRENYMYNSDDNDEGNVTDSSWSPSSGDLKSNVQMSDFEQNKKTKKIRRKSYDNTNNNESNNYNNVNNNKTNNNYCDNNNNDNNNNNVYNEARTVSFSVSMVEPNSPNNSPRSGYPDIHSSVPGLDGPMLVR